MWMSVLSLVTASSMSLPPKTPSLEPDFCDRCALSNICQTDCFAKLHPMASTATASPNPSGIPGVVPFLLFCIGKGKDCVAFVKA